jgi:phosphonate transport system substrate-binding protein
MRRVNSVRGQLKTTLLVCLFIAVLCPHARSEDKLANFGIINVQSSVIELFRPLLDDMGAAMGNPVKAKVFGDYAGVVWAMGANRVQIALMGNKTAMEAVDRANGTIISRLVDLDGEDEYTAHLIVNAASSWKDEKDVLEAADRMTFMRGDPNSTSGSLIPDYYLFSQNGVDAATLFKRVTRGTHEQSFLAVAEGSVDVATNNSASMKQFKTLHPEKFNAVKIIWTSPPIASDPIVLRRTLPEHVRNRAIEFFLHYGREMEGKSAERLAHERSVLAGLNCSGFKASDDSQLIPIRLLELAQLKIRLQRDKSLGEEERDLRLKEVDEKVRKIESQQTERAH